MRPVFNPEANERGEFSPLTTKTVPAMVRG